MYRYRAVDEVFSYSISTVCCQGCLGVRVAAMLWIGLIGLGEAAKARQPQTASLRTDVPFEEHLLRRYGTREALPSNWINDIVQSTDGFIWIATDNGLVRYDGAEFKRVTAEATQQCPQSDIRVLCEGRDGVLWIGTAAGLARLEPAYPAQPEFLPDIPNDRVFAIYEDGDGHVWVGTEADTFVGTARSGFRVVTAAPSNARAFCETRDGALWIGSHFGLFRRQGNRFEQVTHEKLPKSTSPGSGVPHTRVNTIMESDNGDLWIGANRALLHLRDGQFTSRGSEIESQQIYRITQARDGCLYVAARFGLFRSVRESEFENVSDTVSAFCVMEDRDGGLWVGHGDNRGLRQYRSRHATVAWSDSQVRCLLDASESALWLGAKDGLHRVRDHEIVSYGIDDGLPDPRVQSLARSADDSFWIATGRGLAKWSGNEVITPPTAAPLAEMNLGAMLEDSSGTLWLALASSGGYTLRDGQLRDLPSLAGRRIHWFWEDAYGVIWVGHESGLYQHRDGRIGQQRDAAIERLNHPRFLCHHTESADRLWMGTSNGILSYRSGRYEAFPPDAGLRADNIERITTDGQGNLWYGGRDGLFHVSVEELDAYSSGRLTRVTSYRVPGFDRFPPLAAFSSGCLVRDDELWIAAESGLVRMPLEPFRKQRRPPTIRMERVTIDGIGQRHTAPFEFLSGRHRMSFGYAVLSFESRNHLQVAYQLEGHDPDWQVADGEGNAQYTDLRPGRYRFRARVRHGNGAWIEAEHPVAFRVRPRWWEIIWLRIVLVLVATAGAIGFFRHRLLTARRINAELRREMADRVLAEEQSRQHQEQLARVSRAASMGELSTSIAHEIKQPLFAIVSNAQTARKLLDLEQPDVDEVRDALSDIASDGDRASTIIDRIRALVRKEHQPVRNLDINGVVREAASFAEREIRRRHLKLRTELADDLPPVAGDPIELQQVILNLLVNGAHAMTDASSSDIVLRTSVADGAVQVSVEDHGMGISQEKLQQIFEPFYTTKPDGTGMGLAINRTIIDAHGGRIWAQRNETRGMTFCFQLPATSPKARSHGEGKRSSAETVDGDRYGNH